MATYRFHVASRYRYAAAHVKTLRRSYYDVPFALAALAAQPNTRFDEEVAGDSSTPSEDVTALLAECQSRWGASAADGAALKLAIAEKILAGGSPSASVFLRVVGTLRASINSAAPS